ncbi:hypothetical protein LguiB_005877 [Lonicera macranthoides]
MVLPFSRLCTTPEAAAISFWTVLCVAISFLYTLCLTWLAAVFLFSSFFFSITISGY